MVSFYREGIIPHKGLNSTRENLCNPRREGKVPGKTLAESASAIFDTLRRGIPNVFPGPSPSLRGILK
jgi:hypothetical protein